MGSTTGRAFSWSLAYAPFGELYAQSGSTDPAFTGMRSDTSSGLYDFPARQYSITGRWPTPDPSGFLPVHLSDPQTWNKYAYVRNNPLALIDPNGLEDCGGRDNTDGACPDPVGVTAGAPPDGGGGGGGIDAGLNGVSISGTGFCSYTDATCSGQPTDPTSGGDQNNSGSDCASGSTSCGGDPSTSCAGPLINCADPSNSQLGLSNTSSDCWIFCGTKILEDNLATDQKIFKLTEPFIDPFVINESTNGAILAAVNYLESINLIIDKVALGVLTNSALELISGELVNYGANQVADITAEELQGVRNNINARIDVLLGQAQPKP